MLGYGDYQRWLYRNGRPNRVARLTGPGVVEMLKAGITPPRTAVLSVQGQADRPDRLPSRHRDCLYR